MYMYKIYLDCSCCVVQYLSLSASNQKSQLLSPAVPCRNLQKEYMPLLVERSEGSFSGSVELNEVESICR